MAHGETKRLDRFGVLPSWQLAHDHRACVDDCVVEPPVIFPISAFSEVHEQREQGAGRVLEMIAVEPVHGRGRLE